MGGWVPGQYEGKEKMIYVVSGGHTYQCSHLESAIAIGLAKGFRDNGLEACVVWDVVASSTVQSILHIPMRQCPVPEPNAQDILLISNPNIVDDVLQYSWWKDIPRKGLFTSCEHTGKDWSQFKFILAENRAAVIQSMFPSAKVIDFLMGCTDDIDLSKPSPFDSRRTLFFCGRLAEYPPNYSSRIDDLWALADALPAYRIVILSPSITLPERFTPEEWHGQVICPFVDADDAKQFQRTTWGSVTYAYVPNDDAVPIIQAAIGRSNLDFWGVRAWGTFWEIFHHAWCCLDFGFPSEPLAPNTKVIDPLCAGNRIVAYGQSPTFRLFQQYDAGIVVPYRDISAMVRAIESLPEESHEQRVARSLKFRANEGWNAKVGRMIDILGMEALS